MKKLLFLIVAILSIYSCDKSGSVKFEINNYTDYDGTVKYFAIDDTTTYHFYAQTATVTSQCSGLGITTYVINTNADSVIFNFNNGDFIKYYLDSMYNGKKTIYLEKYWEIKEPSRNSFICTFPIYEEDLTTAY